MVYLTIKFQCTLILIMVFKVIIFLCLTSFPLNAENHINELTGLMNVYTADYHISQITNQEANVSNSKSLQLDISGPNTKWNIQLFPNSNFIGMEYKQRAYDYMNKPETGVEFVGFVNGYNDSRVTVSLRDGISGIVHLDGNDYEIYSLKIRDQTSGTIAVKSSSEEREKMKCGIGAISPRSNSYTFSNVKSTTEDKKMKRNRRSINDGNKSTLQRFPNITTTSWHRYIEVFVILDNSFYQMFDSSLDKVHLKCKEIMDAVYGIFQPLEISIVLANMEVWESGDKITVDSNHVETLKRFKSQRWRLLQNGPHHDFTLLLTSVNFAGKTVGYAYVNEMCTPERSVAIVQYTADETALSVGGTIAHEIGHVLGADHDNGYCQTENNKGFGIMMAESLVRLYWSNCSKIYLAKYIDSYHCLRNAPVSDSSISFCGNGIVDHGEQCDCGTNGACSKCCDVNECKLISNATCGSGLCCNYETCNFRPSGTLCRQAGSSCDLPEYCSGTASHCPKDVYKIDGFSCDNGNGHCYHGMCGSRRLLCQDLINPAAKQPESELMDKYRHSILSPCDAFFCQSRLNIKQDRDSKAIINDHHYLWFHSSPLIKYYVNESYYENRPRMNGVPCDEGKMCVKKSCVPLFKNAQSHCKINCSNHGVCNSEGNCHCEDNYAPPDCSSYGYGGSVDSGHARHPSDYYLYKILLCFTIFGLFLGVFLLCFYWAKLEQLWKMRWYMDMKITFPFIAIAVNNCCCPCMNFLTKWTYYIKPKISHSHANEIRGPSVTKKATIYEVDANISPPEAKSKSRGISVRRPADKIRVIPKTSPKVKRKIYLPVDPPTLRPTSKDISRQQSFETWSMQSNLPSRDDPETVTPTIGSLINAFNDLGRQNSEKDNYSLSPIKSSKPQGLRPKSGDPGSNRVLKDSHPDRKPNNYFNRTVTKNVQTNNESLLNPSLFLPQTPHSTTSENLNKTSMPSNKDSFSINKFEKKLRTKPHPLQLTSHIGKSTNKCPPIRPPRPKLPQEHPHSKK